MGHAQEGVPNVGDWILYGGPEIAIYGLTAKGRSTSTQITGPRTVPNPGWGDLGTTISEPIASRELIASFLFGGTFGAMTPALDLPARPRLFVEFNASYPRTVETSFARRGNPGELQFPIGGLPNSPVGEGAMSGGGTQMSAQQQGPQIWSGLGFSLEFPLESAQLIRVKTSAIYSRTILDVEGVTIRPVRLNDDAGPGFQDLSDFRLINLQEGQRKVYHGAGPSFEIEYFPDLQLGPFAVSVYARGQAIFNFTSPQTTLQTCNVAGGQPNECARWAFTQDHWGYSGTLSFRLNWMPRATW